MNQRAKKVRPAHSVDQPLLRVSPRDLDTLLSTLDVRFVALSECLVSAGFRLEMGGIDAPGIHYNVTGMGLTFICDDPPIDLWPHTLIVVPANSPFRFTDADVALNFYMAAMPSMNMPEMRNTVRLKRVNDGRYRGTGNVTMAGRWDVTVVVSKGGKEIGTRTVSVTAK